MYSSLGIISPGSFLFVFVDPDVVCLATITNIHYPFLISFVPTHTPVRTGTARGFAVAAVADIAATAATAAAATAVAATAAAAAAAGIVIILVFIVGTIREV